jgi:hypothetical protein
MVANLVGGLTFVVNAPLVVMTVTLGAALPVTALAIAVLTKAVVAIEVSLSAAAGVGACGSPVKAGDASGASTPLIPIHPPFCRV